MQVQLVKKARAKQQHQLLWMFTAIVVEQLPRSRLR